jgi:hypothetical protein
MDPVIKIKEHIAQLHAVPYDDDTQLDVFLTQVKDTIRNLFGGYSQYITYLNSIHFRPVSALATTEENVRFWAKGKKQLRDLLYVILEDPTLRIYGGWIEDVDEASEKTMEEEQLALGQPRTRMLAKASLISDVTRSFVDRVRHDMESSRSVETGNVVQEIEPVKPQAVDRSWEALPRVRVDLSELYVIDDGVEEFFVHRSGFLPKDQKKRILVVKGGDLRLNARITKFLNTTEATLCETESDGLAGNPVQEQVINNGPFEMAVVALAADCWIRSRTDGQDAAVSSPSPLSCFQLGYLVSRLGRGRVIVVYEESNKFHRPTGYFDVIYVPMDPAGVWRREISARLQDNNIAVRDLLRPLYRG